MKRIQLILLLCLAFACSVDAQSLITSKYVPVTINHPTISTQPTRTVRTYLIKHVLCYDIVNGWCQASIRLAEDRYGYYLHSYKIKGNPLGWTIMSLKAYVHELSDNHSLSDNYTYYVSPKAGIYTFYF